MKGLKMTAGDIKYLFHYKDLIGQNGYYGSPMRVRFLTEQDYVEINEDNSRKVYWTDGYEPSPDRLSSVERLDEDTYVTDSYEECYNLYCKVRQEQTQSNIDKLERELQYQKTRIKSFKAEAVKITDRYKKAKDSTYPKYISYRTISIRVRDIGVLIIKIKHLFETERIILWKPDSGPGEAKLIVNLVELNRVQKLEFLMLMRGLTWGSKIEFLNARFGIFTLD